MLLQTEAQAGVPLLAPTTDVWTAGPLAQEASVVIGDPNSGERWESRWLLGVQSNADLDRLAQQRRLLGLMPPERIKRIVTCDLTHKPPRLTLSRSPQSLAEFLIDASIADRWHVASEIFSTFFHAIQLGLLHGRPSVASIGMSPAGLPEIDFLERFYVGAPRVELGPVEQDIRGVLEIVSTILAPIVDETEFTKLVGQRCRAQVKQLLRQTIEDHEYVVYDQWCQILVRGTSVLPPTPLRTEPAIACQPIDEDTSTKEILVQPITVTKSPDASATAELDPSTMSYGNEDRGLQVGDTVARFRLEALLGQGGMGQVFRATDLATEDCVALKILRPTGNVAQSIRRFQKESRLLSQLNNPYVTRLIDCGQDGRNHYLALEYVDGTDLKRWVAARGGRLDEKESLAVVADIARGLVDAHANGIVHRDIKPENVLLGRREPCSENLDHEPLSKFVVKLTDFGIARSLEQQESLAITQQGSLLGTPLFMAPEQFKGTDGLSPATDVYALGVTLFGLLAGRAPFVADDPMKLAAMHCFDPPPDIRRLHPTVADATCELLARMLQKNPDKRPADAAQVVREIEKILRGECRGLESHPLLPPTSTGQPWQNSLSWDLSSTPAELWPLVSDTDRLNRAMGLRAVHYRTEADPVRGQRRFGSFRIMGLRLEWEEHPFEWIEGQRMGVLREFESGPFRWFSSVVELQPLPSGGTRLHHTIKIEPRHWLGRLLASFEAGFKARRSLEQVYRRIDRSIQSRQPELRMNRFEPTSKVSSVVQRRLEQRLEAMLSLGANLELATQLVDYLKFASTQDVGQIRPLELAEMFPSPAEHWIDTCLVAARCGLLKLHWEILCPTCRVSAATADGLQEIGQHTHCGFCDADFQSDIANSIEMVFHSHPEIREADTATYCIGGPMQAPHVLTQLRCEANERVEVRVELDNGSYLLRGVGNGQSQLLQVRAQTAPSSLDLCLSQLKNVGHTSTLRRGTVLLSLTNDQDRAEVVRLERTVSRGTVVTAAVASALPKFREYFPEQRFERTQAVTADDLTLIAVRLLDLERLYGELGDAAAYRLLQNTFQRCEEFVVAAGGAFVKSEGDVFLAAFPECQQSVRAAIRILGPTVELINSAPEPAGTDAQAVAPNLSVCIHRGPVLMTTQNGRLDYFGSTVRQTLAFGQVASQGLLMTAPVFTDPAVEQCLEDVPGAQVIAKSVELKGFPPCLIQQLQFAGDSR